MKGASLSKNKSQTQIKTSYQGLKGIRPSSKDQIDNLLKELLENDRILAKLIKKRESLLSKLMSERKTSNYIEGMSEFNVERAQLEANSLVLQKKLERFHFTSSDGSHTQQFFT